MTDVPPWLESPERKKYPQLTSDKRADVVVIGGGIAGVVSAYRLTQAGKKVILIEKGRLGENATGYTTAFITSVIDTSPSQLIRLFGETSAKQIWQSQLDALDFYKETIEKEHIACEYTSTNAYFYANTDAELPTVHDWFVGARDLDIPAAMVEPSELGFGNVGALKFPNQGKFHPLMFIAGLAGKIIRDGGLIYEQTEAVEIKTDGLMQVVTREGVVTADDVVMTTDVPFTRPDLVRVKLRPYTTYVLTLELPKNSLPEGLYSDALLPYHYLRVDRRSNHDRIILGGEDHPQLFRFLHEKSFALMRRYAKDLLSQHRFSIVRAWDGQILEPIDGIPLIGRIAPRVYTATGFSGNGMTYSAVAGKLFCDLILGKTSPLEKIYDPNRVVTLSQRLAKGTDYLNEIWSGVITKIFRQA